MRKVDKYGLMVNEDIGRCWAWTGSKRNGYGEFNRTGAHRVSYRLFKGDIPRGLFVLHICDNRECINPDHLKIGTNKQNVDDKVKKGRAKGGNGRKGENIVTSKLTNDQVKEIRENPHDKCLNCLARQFGVSFQQISRIKHNERWTQLVEKETEEDNFWKRAVHEKKVIREDLGECWETIRNKMQFSYNGKAMLSHRVAYTITKGEIPKGMVIRHKCDNSKCINPEHLELGSQQENIQDKVKRGRVPSGDKHMNAKLTNIVALEIYNFKGTQSLSETARQYNISKQNVKSIWDKKTWKHIH